MVIPEEDGRVRQGSLVVRRFNRPKHRQSHSSRHLFDRSCGHCCWETVGWTDVSPSAPLQSQSGHHCITVSLLVVEAPFEGGEAKARKRNVSRDMTRYGDDSGHGTLALARLSNPCG